MLTVILVIAIVALLFILSVAYPLLYPNSFSRGDQEFVKITQMVYGTLLFIAVGYAMLYRSGGAAVNPTNAGWRSFRNPYDIEEPARATWNDVVRRADRGRTVRLANLTEAQDPVSLDSFEEGQRIVLLPAGNRRTPFHLNTVQEMRRRPPFSHPMTRQRMRNENIELVRIER